MKDVMGDATLGFKVLVGPDEVALKKKEAAQQQLSQKGGVPVHVNPVVMKDVVGEATLGINMRVGPDEVSIAKKDVKKLAQLNEKNPVYNPPMNNWSVNQPSPPHQHGLAGD